LLNHLFTGALGTLSQQSSKLFDNIFELSRSLNIGLEDIILENTDDSGQLRGKLKPQAYRKVLNFRINQLMNSQLSIENSHVIEPSIRYNIESGRFEKTFYKLDVLGQGAYGKVRQLGI